MLKAQWYLMFGAMLTPIGFSLLIVKGTKPELPESMYTIGLILGCVGILCFILTIPIVNELDKKHEKRENHLINLVEAIANKLGVDTKNIK